MLYEFQEQVFLCPILLGGRDSVKIIQGYPKI